MSSSPSKPGRPATPRFLPQECLYCARRNFRVAIDTEQHQWCVVCIECGRVVLTFPHKPSPYDGLVAQSP